MPLTHPPANDIPTGQSTSSGARPYSGHDIDSYQMMPPTPRLAIVQTTFADYRIPMMQYLNALVDGELRVVAGGSFSYFDPRLETSVPDQPWFHKVENHFLLGRRLLWQRLPWQMVLTSPGLLVEYNPRVLSSWLLVIVRRVTGRHTVVWGHAWSRAGRRVRTLPIRTLMRRIADETLVYTDTEADQLASSKQRVTGMSNSLYPADEIVAAGDGGRPTNFLYVSRFFPEKKPQLLIEGFLSALDRLPSETRLILVGSGPDRGPLEALARTRGRGRIVISPSTYDRTELRKHYERALFTVSPGFVGLSLIQSLSFGVPVLIARNEPHAPEIEAAEEGVNTLTFPSDDVDALADALVAVTQDPSRWIRKRASIAASCAKRYSIEISARRIMEAARVSVQGG